MSEALRGALRAQGGALAAHVVARPGAGPPPPAGASGLACAGPRVRGREKEYALLLEMIAEGSRLHYGSPRAVATDDPDLALLLGDQLYALGLVRLAELDDIDAVAELADAISLVAQAHVASHPALAEAVWDAGAAAIGWGTSPAHEVAKDLARAGDRGAVAALRAAAERRER